MMDELSDEFPCLMEQNIVSFLKRYLSYGNEDKPPLEYRVYFQVKRTKEIYLHLMVTDMII